MKGFAAAAALILSAGNVTRRVRLVPIVPSVGVGLQDQGGCQPDGRAGRRRRV